MEGWRNINTYQRGVLALALKPLLAKKAKEKQLSTLKQNSEKSNEINSATVSQNSVKRINHDTQKELAKTAKVSHDTIAKIEYVETKAPKEIREKAYKGDISTHKAYKETKKKTVRKL